MRTNIEIDDSLMDSILESGHYSTKKDAVEAGLRLLKHKIAQLELLKLRGKVEFFSDSDYSTYPAGSSLSKVAED
ncbi:type II toxin-antitoxin system VapB family antitoxin [bacterium]|nr:MAG: type II toxin-antitoxin system VapB family antitoxin [bacterium]